MQTTLAPSTLSDPTPQTLHHVLRAESARSVGRGGLGASAMAAAVLGTAAGVGVHAASAWMASSAELGDGLAAAPHSAAASGVEAAAVVATLILALAAIVRVSRDQGAALGSMLLIVPRRGRLFSAQLLTLGGAAALVLSATVVLTTAAISALGGETPALPLATTGALGVLAGVVVVLLAGGLAAAVRSLPAALLAFLAVLVVLPLLLAMAPMALPTAVGKAVGAAGAWLPAQTWFGATAVSSVSSVTPAALLPLLGRLAVLGAWAAAAVTAGWAVLRVRDA